MIYDVTGWTVPEVLEMFTAAKSSLIAGDKIISWGSAGSNVTKQIHDSPAEICAWCQWALRELEPQTYGKNLRRTIPSFNVYQ